MGNGRGSSENTAILVLRAVRILDGGTQPHRPLTPPPRTWPAFPRLASGRVKKEEPCEKLPLKEVLFLGVVQGQGVPGPEEGRELKRGRQDSGRAEPQ